MQQQIPPLDRDYPSKRALMEQELITQVNEASRRYQSARQKSEAVLKLYTELGAGDPAGTDAVRRARRQESAARDRYIAMLEAFTDLILQG